MIWQQPINDIQANVVCKLKSAYSVRKASVPQEVHCLKHIAYIR